MVKVKRLNMRLLSCILVSSILFTLSVAKPVLADVPRVIDVVPWSSGSDVMLNVTIYHDVGAEVTGHYVDNIEVNVGGNIQNFAQSGPHTYYDTNNHYFNVTVGPITGVTGTPTATVRAHDNLHGWSQTNWTGQIPELSPQILLLALFLATFIAIIARSRPRRQFTNC
jgi:hypothetical protein